MLTSVVVSMIDGVFLDKLEYVARRIRDTEAPFGNIQVFSYCLVEGSGVKLWQLVVCGDFYQLPPVPDTIDGIKRPTKFAFEANCWDKCIPNLVTLTKIFRQKDSSTFILLLAPPTFELYNSI